MELEFASLRTKTTIYNAAGLAVMALFLLLAGYALYVVRINGPLYHEIRREHDLVADALPPSLYIVDPHLDVTDALLAAERHEFDRSQALLQRALASRSRYESKVSDWARQIDSVEIKDAFTDVAPAPARQYFSVVEQSLMPAVAHHDVIRARQVYEDTLVPLFVKHRQAIEHATDLARAESESVEAEASATVTRISLGIALAAIGLSVFWWWAVQRWWIRPLVQRVSDVQQALSRIGDGDYERAVVVGQADEFGRILESIESMRSRLQVTVHELDEKRLSAQAAERAKSQFLANMSHEIRTPMNAILGMTELTLRTPLNPKQQEYLTKSHEAGRALLALMDQILDWSKIEAGAIQLEYEPFEFDAVMGRVSSIVEDKAISKGLSWVVQIDPGLRGLWMGDANRVGQVLINLCNNAVKFTERGGVVVSIQPLSSSPSEQLVHFSVRDTGIGMTSEQQQRVFQPFAQADATMARRFGGTGLGLVISQQLVALMGGELSAQSVAGQGSDFRFDLKLRKADPKPKAEPASSSPAPRQVALTDWPGLKGRSVLLVEDNEFNQMVAGELLRDVAGMWVAIASSGEEALALLSQQSFDAVLMDIQMPGLDGYESTRQLRAQSGANARIPVIAMTAHATEQDRQQCLAAGMNDYISKPVMPQELFTLLEKWIGARRAP